MAFLDFLNNILLWLHMTADTLLLLANYIIPVMLAYFVWHRKDLQFRRIFILLGTFILACGLTSHALENVILLDLPNWLDIVIQSITHIVIPVFTAVIALWIFPKVLSLPSTAQLDKEEQDRQHAYEALELAQRQLVETNQSLENSVTARTNELTQQKTLYNMLSKTNQAIVHINNCDALFQEICQIIVDVGKFHFVWVGMLDPVTKKINVTQRYGNDGGYIDKLHFTLNDAVHGPTVTSILTGVPFITNDFLNSPSTRPWHEAAKLSGIRGSGVFPIKLHGEVIGAFNLYANEIAYFSDILMTTLQEMSEDISFALENFAKEEVRLRQAKELEASAEQMRGLAEQSIAGIYIIQDGEFVYCNNHFAGIFGYSSGTEMIGLDARVIVDEQDRSSITEKMRVLQSKEKRDLAITFHGLCKDGSRIVVGAHSTGSTYKGRPALIGLAQDISEKMHNEEKIQRYIVQIQDALMNTVEVAMNLSEMRDPYTVGHERRVAEIAVAISAEMGFDTNRQQGMRIAGYLHDIGKITIPAEILSKPGKLSKFEFELIKGHAQASYDVLKNVEFPWPVAEIALQHHERMNGAGYPQGLKGEDIIIEARILAVADTVEAMSSHRPYRQGLGIEKALDEITRGRGIIYDAAVVDACLCLFNEKGYQLPMSYHTPSTLASGLLTS